MAELKAEAARIEHETDLDCQSQAREAEINFIREQNELEVSKAKELSIIEVRWGTSEKFSSFEGGREMFDIIVVNVSDLPEVCDSLTKLHPSWSSYSIVLFAQVGKFSNAVDSLGSKTLASIARAGPDTKVSSTTAMWCLQECTCTCILLLPESSSHKWSIFLL